MEIRLWRSKVTMRHAIDAAHQRHEHRERLFLEIEAEGVSGFGEVDPQPVALNADPGIDEVLDELVGLVIPRLRDMSKHEGALPSWSRLGRLAGPRRASNPALALVEMALLERELRVAGRTLQDLWPPMVATPLQVSASLIGDDPWHVSPDAARVRVKADPRRLDARALERLKSLRVPVLLDLNCSAFDDDEVIELVHRVAEVTTIAGLEQPYAPGNVVDHARLAQRLDVAISIDEGLRSMTDVRQIVRYGAAQMICVKPARVGGLANARTIIARAREAGLRPYLGGFFESTYARTVHLALARQGVDEPSDVALVESVEGADTPEVDLVPGAFGVRPSAQMLERARPVAFFDGTAI